MTKSVWVTCALAVLSLAACGSGDTDAAETGEAPSAKAAPSGEASAEQVAKEMRGKVKCPARVTTARPAGAAVDDVVGLRPGMTWDEAANLVMCDRPLIVVVENSARRFDVNTYGQHVRQGFDAKFAEPRVVKTSREVLKDMQDEAMRRGMNTYVAPLEPGQVRYYVSSMGLPGEERVVSVAREEYFAEGKLPTVESVKEALVAKYGEPSQMEGGGSMPSLMYWQYDPAGARIDRSSHRLIACRISVSPDAGTSLSTECGVTVGAQIMGSRDNAGLAHSLAVSSQNGADGYALLQRTTDALRMADDARKAKELNAAAKGADAPKL